jgi:hypothetical protein
MFRRVATLLAFAIATVIAVPTQTSAIVLDTGNGRIDIRLRDEQTAINTFDGAITTYRILFNTWQGIPSESELQAKADEISGFNQTLQGTSFSTGISQAYTDSAAQVKQTAANLTAVVNETASRTYTDADDALAAREAIEEAEAPFDAAATALETAASEYTPPSPLWLIPLIGGLVGAFVLMLVILVKRSNKKKEAELFADDPVAAQFTKEQKKFIRNVHIDLAMYESAMKSGNAALMKGFETGVYAKIATTDLAALGKFAAAAYEYKAIVELANQNTEQAKAEIAQAVAIKGDSQLITESGRQLAAQQ